jgi:uncharacterized protein (TIGR03067 family)
MKLRAVVVGVVALASGFVAVAADDNQALVGTWAVVAVEKDGKEMPAEQLKGLVVRFDSSGKASGHKGDKVIFEATFKVDATKQPKTIDATQTSDGKDKGKVTLGIYEINGDTLRTCISETGKDRPTDFSAKAGSGQIVRVYKRQSN